MNELKEHFAEILGMASTERWRFCMAPLAWLLVATYFIFSSLAWGTAYMLDFFASDDE